jgi:hypothetical protein
VWTPQILWVQVQAFASKTSAGLQIEVKNSFQSRAKGEASAHHRTQMDCQRNRVVGRHYDYKPEQQGDDLMIVE